MIQLPNESKPTIRKSELRVKFADGSIQNTDGIITMNVQIGRNVQPVDFLLGRYSDQAMLGMNDLMKFSLEMNFKSMLISAGDLWIPVHDIANTSIGRKAEVCGRIRVIEVSSGFEPSVT